jgi:hypothetical protein
MFIALLAGAWLLPGCKGKSSAPPDGEQATPPPATGQKTKALTAYRGKVLVRERVSPTAADRAVRHESGITVTVPGGLLDSPAEVVVAETANLPPPVDRYVNRLASVDVTIGDLRELGREVTLDLPAGRDGPLPERVWSAYWDDRQATWVTLPTEVDRQHGIVRVRTNHLCPIVVEGTQVTDKSRVEINVYSQIPVEISEWTYGNKWFCMTFDPKEIRRETHPAQPWYAATAPDVQPIRADMPRFVEDAWAYLNFARDNYYKTPGLREMPQFVKGAVWARSHT